MKNIRQRMLVVLTLFILFTVSGCRNTILNNEIYNESKIYEEDSKIEVIIQEEPDVSAEEEPEVSVEEEPEISPETKRIEENNITSETKRLPIVDSGDYVKAYAQALYEGGKVPTKEAYLLMEKYRNSIENEPRLVMEDGELHIIWTNSEMNLVIDGIATSMTVADCIYVEVLPQLPTLSEMREYHEKNNDVRFGIAETVFLERLCSNLKVNSLYRVRFYNDMGKAVAVYSLDENGKLYIY